jgi:SAM-dependent methyltransferase
MGFYQRWIVPHLINLAMRNRSLDAYRQRTIGAASGLVPEIGVGSGQNLPLYGSAVDRVYAIDPSMELLHIARNRIAEARLPVSLIRASAEQLPFADAIFDTIIMTWTLCSIPKGSRHPQARRSAYDRKALSTAAVREPSRKPPPTPTSCHEPKSLAARRVRIGRRHRLSQQGGRL